MKKYNIILLIVLIYILLLSCSDDVKVLSAIEDGKELEEGTVVPFMLHQNYPNPFDQFTTINYEVAKPMPLCLKVFSDDWQEVKILIDREHDQGFHSVFFNGMNSDNKQLPSGEYFYTLEGNGLTLIRKMKLIK
jgi:hypothetical protein